MYVCMHVRGGEGEMEFSGGVRNYQFLSLYQISTNSARFSGTAAVKRQH